MAQVLLVIADRQERQILKIALAGRGLEVEDFEECEAGYIACHRLRPDLLVIEITDTYSLQLRLLRLLSGRPATRGIPVLAYGSMRHKSLLREALRPAPRRFLLRPLKIGAVLHELEQSLKERGLPPPDFAKPRAIREKYLQRLLDRTVEPREKMDLMVSHVQSRLPLPSLVNRLLEVDRDDHAGAAKLARALEEDAEIAALLLRLANSAAHAPAGGGRQVEEVKEAVVRIGFAAARDFALGLCLFRLFGRESREKGHDRGDFLGYSLSCAGLAESLARKSGYARPSEAFLTGLLHDFGALILDEFFGEELLEPLLAASAGSLQGERSECSEERLLGFNRHDFLQKVLEAWGLPARLRRALKERLSFPAAVEGAGSRDETAAGSPPGSLPPDEASPALRDLAALTAVSAVLARSMGLGGKLEAFAEPFPLAVLRNFPDTPELEEEILAEAREQIAIYRRFLGLAPLPAPGAGKGAENQGPRSMRILVYRAAEGRFEPHLCHLRHRGHILTSWPKDTEPPEGSFDLLVLSVYPEGGPQTLVAPLQWALNPPPGEGREPESLPSPPVLLFSPTGRKETAFERLSQIQCLPLSGDLRRIDAAVARLVG